MTTTPSNPFASESRPSLSFKDAPIGTSYTGTVVDHPGWVQARSFETGDALFWPDGNPRMQATVTVKIGQLVGANGPEDDGTRTIYAPKPSSIYSAIAFAQRAAGAPIAPGDVLTVVFTGEKPNPQKPMLNPQKLYSAQLVKGPGVFQDETPAASVAAPAAPAPVAAPAAPAPVAAPAAPAPVAAPAAPAPVAAPAAPAPLTPEQLQALIAQNQAAAVPAAPAIPPEVVSQVQQLRAVGMSDADIAQALGLTVEQVSAL